MMQQKLVIGKTYKTFRELYDDQNDTFKAQIRDFYKTMGYSKRSVFRKIDELIKDSDDLDRLYFGFGICRTPKQGYFFELTVHNNETFGLS